MKISIIVPCYNASLYVEKALLSCLQQTYSNFEVIFVDNESTDDSMSIAGKVQKQFKSLQISSAPNKYRYSWEEPVTEAMKIMTGEYFTIVGADDIIIPEYLDKCVEQIKSAGNPKCLQSGLVRFQKLDGTTLPFAFFNYGSLEEEKTQLLQHCCVNTPTVFYHRSLYEDGHITWNSVDYLGACDYDLYCQFASKGIMIHPVQGWLGYLYREHPAQSTWGMVAEIRRGNHIDKRIQEYWRERWMFTQ